MEKGNRVSTRKSSVEKLQAGFLLGLVLGVVWGGLRVAWLYYAEDYAFAEIRLTFRNHLFHSLLYTTLRGVLAGVAFALIWSVYERLQGLILAGVMVAVPLVPAAYLANKRILPGVREPESLLGNGLLALVGLGLTVWLFRRWTRNWRFVPALVRKPVVAAALILLVGALAGYGLQPSYARLEAASARPEALLERLELPPLPANHHGSPSGSAEERLRTYFQARTQKRLAAFRRKLAAHDSAAVLANADAVLERRFEFVGVSHTLRDPIDWRTNPTSERVWIFALNRQEWLWDVVAAYFLTGEPRYAQAVEELVLSWLDQNPLATWKNEANPTRRLIETSLRMTGSWLDAFDVLFASPDVSDSFKWRMLAAIHDHAQFLLHFRSPAQNHLLQETFGLMAVAGRFPEFKMAPRWLEIANLRLSRLLKREIYPDGGYYELSTFYHRFVIRILQQIAEFARENDVALADFVYQELERMYEFLMYLARPDGRMPQVNDGFHAKNLRVLYHQPAKMFQRADFAFFASGGEAGRPPDSTSLAFPYSGLYVMRTDWSPQAHYVLVDAGPFGSAHGHEDKLSFELHAFGRPFIIESGTYTYNYNRWHHYFESSFAHNTIVVDGRSQLRARNPKKWVVSPPQKQPNVWISNQRFDYLEAVYDEGYGNKKEDVLQGLTHHRRLLFVKPYYWVLWDIVTGEGEHTVTQLFHAAPEVRVEMESERRAWLAYPNGPALRLEILAPASLAVRRIVGREDPIQGWVSSRYGEKQKAPVLEFEAEGELPVTFVQVLLPAEQASELGDVRVELLPVQTQGEVLSVSEALGLRIRRADSADYILMAPGVDGEKRLGAVTTKKQIEVVQAGAAF